MNSPGQIEEQLCRELASVGQQYSKALGLFDELSSVADDPDRRDHRLRDMQSIMDGLHEHEARLAPLRARWKATGCRPGPHLRRVLDEQEHLLTRLIARVDECHQQLSRQRARLVPQLEAGSNRRDMLRAYGKRT